MLAPDYPPPGDLVVSQADDLGDAWRIFYTSRRWFEDGDIKYALGGNWPYLVDKSSGEVLLDEDYHRKTMGLDVTKDPDDWVFVGTDEDPEGNNRRAYHKVLARYPHLIDNPLVELRMDVVCGRDGIARVQVWQRPARPKREKRRLP